MEEGFSNQSLKTFVSQLGSDLPAPGGGAAAGVCGALGAALGRMVAELTRGRGKYAEFEPDAMRASEALQPLIDRFLMLAEADQDAYNGYMAALALPKETEDDRMRRSTALGLAVRTATEVPCSVLQTANDAIDVIESLVGRSNATCMGDLAAGAASLRAAGKTAWLNILANLPYYSDGKETRAVYRKQQAALDRLTEKCDGVYEEIEYRLEKKLR